MTNNYRNGIIETFRSGVHNMKYIRKLNNEIFIKTVAFILLVLACTIEYYSYLKTTNTKFELQYENINIKDMAMAKVSEKKSSSQEDTATSIFKIYKEMKSGNYSTTEAPTEVALPIRNNTLPTLQAPKRIWYLPCEIGTITSEVTYSHYALDITSPRGTAEAIYPIANGVISGIYSDRAGAKIVTINHTIDGKNYSSQYVHLSSYAPDLYVGKPVTINDYLGYMGRTGIATGVHLHLAVVDCSIFNPADNNCSTLNGFFRYGKQRLSQGFYGPYSVMNIPHSWSSR